MAEAEIQSVALGTAFAAASRRDRSESGAAVGDAASGADADWDDSDVRGLLWGEVLSPDSLAVQINSVLPGASPDSFSPVSLLQSTIPNPSRMVIWSLPKMWNCFRRYGKISEEDRLTQVNLASSPSQASNSETNLRGFKTLRGVAK